MCECVYVGVCVGMCVCVYVYVCMRVFAYGRTNRLYKFDQQSYQGAAEKANLIAIASSAIENQCSSQKQLQRAVSSYVLTTTSKKSDPWRSTTL